MAQPKFPYTGNPNSHDPSEFANGMTGTCLCGSISVTIKDLDLFKGRKGHLCHCANCRKVAGSYVSANMLMKADQVELIDRDGTLKTYLDYATGSGKPVHRSFCSTDGNPIKSETELAPGMVILKMGIYPRIPPPSAEAFAEHRHDWQAKHEGVEQYATTRSGPKLGE
ncbi:hypothetical protein K469DRAFT_630840 [Zopfia rhizophila CBS 207.26]|uniref:CENP-V/GFA domain-containing protein n=1 Tax=Zopfia rhizophila CBS 207.26 TaxID=1314779 RepID=A0A6A6E4D9_9PEZI|nr:hypothetical protein K469DRAFT_630840 [Zopfia rhizophila CBS 207.26]